MIIGAILFAQIEFSHDEKIRWRHRHERTCRAVMMSALNPLMPRAMTPFELHWKAVLDALGGKNETASKRPDF